MRRTMRRETCWDRCRRSIADVHLKLTRDSLKVISKTAIVTDWERASIISFPFGMLYKALVKHWNTYEVLQRPIFFLANPKARNLGP